MSTGAKTIEEGSTSTFFVVSGPGGTGKTTLIREWRKREPDLHYVANITTRKPRDPSKVREENFFIHVSSAEFRRLVEENHFAQWVNPSRGKYYGTPRAPLDEAIEKGWDLVFDYTPQLYLNLRRRYREQVVGIFVAPPDLVELRRRLEGRGTESGTELEIKYEMALQDFDFVDEHEYHVVNDDLADALRRLQAIRVAEKTKLARQKHVLKRYVAHARTCMMFYYDPLNERVSGITDG